VAQTSATAAKTVVVAPMKGEVSAAPAAPVEQALPEESSVPVARVMPAA
jgi:hypothetical protein